MNEKFDSIVDNKWWQEIAVVAFSFTIYTLKNDWMLFSSMASILMGIFFYLILYLHAQFNRFFLLPILFKTRRPVTYILLTLFGVVVFSIVLYEITTLDMFNNCRLYQNSHQRSYVYQLASVLGTLVCILSPIIVFKFYRIHKRRTDEALLFNQMQLNSLKGQLNPHFLFNTFNTLYGISLEFPDRTPDLIMKVSQLMRYQLESNSKQCVSLEDELEFINSYVQLEKERVGYRCDVTYDCKIDNENAYKISPMLLIAFIENAFKHGTCAIEKCFVRIFITVEKGDLHLHVVNSIPTKKTDVVSTKIGLKNTIERLNLIYGKNYKLDIQEEKNTYIVDLKLQLKKFV
ncbi:MULTISPECIES: sensor histidine kinase [Flavobacterium]|uniref:Histidine kinase n=1 Tax=Flavobacterium oncorhynchi TaxID=728056 RepID=A0A226I244_9FLAO|nr:MULTISPECIES: histidine kinase [Flavobacterium]OXB00179.1 histidine kinase [Flavobacterium oncorhynchi]RXM42267.1 histidine kinase [Flavobacterium sp. YO64]RXM45346.1 histidine kinase [Flavobacterium sp. YO12]